MRIRVYISTPITVFEDCQTPEAAFLRRQRNEWICCHNVAQKAFGELKWYAIEFTDMGRSLKQMGDNKLEWCFVSSAVLTNDEPGPNDVCPFNWTGKTLRIDGRVQMEMIELNEPKPAK